MTHPVGSAAANPSEESLGFQHAACVLIVVGAGDRGAKHAKWALAHPDRAHVVGVAEPREVHRARFGRDHALPPERTTSDWRDLAALGKFADAVLICTPDRLHVEPATYPGPLP
ncbi:Gfo/Idh/MocA family oxidoreductase [Streptomyces sp. NPDC058466]|uniref:Gfo/Idh/MocA family oxidoreductase n=1 Tax=Streptomyces sp. NPDC058466 TaxID=3346512 RepID=UPI0036571322